MAGGDRSGGRRPNIDFTLEEYAEKLFDLKPCPPLKWGTDLADWRKRVAGKAKKEIRKHEEMEEPDREAAANRLTQQLSPHEQIWGRGVS